MLFGTGFLLMGFEMLGSRYLNPWFGGGITTWASLISVVLLAMMAGYMTGGQIADRSQGLTPMAIAIGLSGAYMLGVAAFADPVIERILDSLGDGFAGVLASSFLLCFLPVGCLAGLSPYVVKLLLHRISQGGRTTGLVYAVSTAGNIAGTLVTVFWLIPLMGTRVMTSVFGWSLIVLAVMVFLVNRRGKLIAAILFVIAGHPIANSDRAVAAEVTAKAIAASYPEGPLWLGRSLIYGEMTADRVSIWNGKTRRTLMPLPGCGPTSVAGIDPTRIAVNCHLGGEVIIAGHDGAIQRTITHDGNGRALRNPNDINGEGGGPVFFTDPGPFDIHAMPSGRIYRLDEVGIAHLVHKGMHYPNGVAFDADSSRLYVSEHLARQVRVLTLADDFSVRANEVLLKESDIFGTEGAPGTYAGPDGLRLATDGSIHVAIYGAGFVLIVAPDGTRRRVSVPQTYVTSVALSQDRVAISGAYSNTGEILKGSVLVLPRADYEVADRIVARD